MASSHQQPAAAAAPSSDCASMPVGFELTRCNAAGSLSVFEPGALRIDAEAGTVIRVHAGCLWVPNDAAHCSDGIAAGEQIRIDRTGLITTLAMHRTQLELIWPEPAGAVRPVQSATN